MTTDTNAILADRALGESESIADATSDDRAPEITNRGSATNPITYPEQLRFEVPVPPTFPLLGSITSVLSLVLMSVVSTLMFLELVRPTDGLAATILASAGDGLLGPIADALGVARFGGAFPAWTWVPFLFTIFGSTLGFIFELSLIVAGTPFQQTKSPFTTTIQRVRFLNLAPVTTTIFFFVVTMTIPDPSLRLALLFLSVTVCTGLGFALFFGPPNPVVPMVLLGFQVAQAILVLVVGIPLGGVFLLAQAMLQLSALIVGTSTPKASTIFHVTSTLSGVMLYASLLTVTHVDPGFAERAALAIPAGSLTMWGLVVAGFVGIGATIKAFPLAWSGLRVVLTNAVWVPIYFKLVSAERFPNPDALDKLYSKRAPKKAKLAPYSVAHSQNLPQALSIPAVGDDELERNVTVFADLLEQAKSAFKLIALLDHSAPQANVATRLADKARLAIWDDGSRFWPKLFEKTIFGAALPDGGRLESTPKPAIDAFDEGQLLAYLTEFGVGSSFARPALGRGVGALVSDFRFLERYETKPDYESYGGLAYFRVDQVGKRLVLESVVAPQTTREIVPNPADPAFRRAEAMVLASLYYQVISGKHLAEIHMTFNLVEVSMHNAFDAAGQWNHPFRTFLYLHFFSHELAEELTTEHLVQEGAVFSQIFATTDDALIDHLNDCYANFEYGVDEDFEARVDAMSTGGTLLPKCSVAWELEYFEIFHAYAKDLIDIIYASDDDVRNDRHLQDFHRGLVEVFVRGLPTRYDRFQSKAGVARFAADTIHHATVRHQVYGTTGIKAALDPRISKTQVPKDGGTTAVEEWRSLAYVALATGKARFTLLTGPSGQDFTYLLAGVEEPRRERMATVFTKLQTDLRALETKWTSEPSSKVDNYDYLRALPSELHTGPGY